MVTDAGSLLEVRQVLCVVAVVKPGSGTTESSQEAAIVRELLRTDICRMGWDQLWMTQLWDLEEMEGSQVTTGTLMVLVWLNGPHRGTVEGRILRERCAPFREWLFL